MSKFNPQSNSGFVSPVAVAKLALCTPFMSVASLLLQARRGAPAADLPLLLSENVPLLKSWVQAFNSASFDFIASSSQVINLKRARKPTASFMYEEHGNANLSEDVMSDAFHTEAFACAPHEVLAMCKQPPAGTSVYYTQEVSKDVLDERTPGWQDLASGAVNNKPIRCSVWMSSQGANTHAHYDAFDNVIVQLYGKKRVTLWPPREHWQMRVFPDAHPRARKSRPLTLVSNMRSQSSSKPSSKGPLPTASPALLTNARSGSPWDEAEMPACSMRRATPSFVAALSRTSHAPTCTSAPRAWHASARLDKRSSRLLVNKRFHP